MKPEIDVVQDQILEELLDGLNQNQKMIPSKYFYDEKGSKLFDEICLLDEYYPTRTEQKIMEDNIDEIISCFRDESIFIEFGSGSSTKTKLLLNNLKNIKAYLPIDISEVHLHNTAEKLRQEFVNLDIHPIVADYTKPIFFPEEYQDSNKKVAYFPGSTLGNFTNDEAKDFLKMVADECGKSGSLLIGLDLIKDTQILHDAYNDSKGITAEFNLNLLSRLNSEYDADIEHLNFKHDAFYNVEESRIEMHLKSKVDQTFKIFDDDFSIKKDETILTEYSYKYSYDSFASLCDGIFEIRKFWTDEKEYFGVLFLDVKKN